VLHHQFITFFIKIVSWREYFNNIDFLQDTAYIRKMLNFDQMISNVLNLSSCKIETHDIVSYLKLTIQIREICQQVLYRQIIQQAAQEQNITVADAEVQEAGDRWRLENRLEKAADTFRWLENQMITAEELEAGIRDRLLSQKLAETLFKNEIDTFFIHNRLDFNQVLLYQIVVNDLALAKELLFQIQDREISFFEAAHLYDQDEQRRQRCGHEGFVYRCKVQPDVAAMVFNAQSGSILGPLKTDQGYHLFLVKEFIPAQLTPELYQSLLDERFQTWLNDELNHFL
jgi:parvulin-like peptidyl-prolyl isomerase